MIYNDDFKYCFDESKCCECGGKCCTGESGYIFATNEELKKLADFKGLSLEEFGKKFCKAVGRKISLIEKPYKDGFACIFFDEINKNCSVYEVRPMQCKTFPFWEYFKNNLEELKKECIGVKLY